MVDNEYVFKITGDTDVLLVAEYFLTNFQSKQVQVHLVHPGSGYREFAQRILQRKVHVNGYKVIVLLIGRADVLNRQIAVDASLLQVREAVNEVDPCTIIMVGTPLPWPTDQVNVVRKLFRTTAMLRQWCQPHTTLQYTKATQSLVNLEGLNPQYICDDGLTLAGLLNLKRIILGKIACARLRDEYLYLCSVPH